MPSGIIGFPILVHVAFTEMSRLRIVLELDLQHVHELLLYILIEDRTNNFNPVIKISGHPVGGGDIVFIVSSIAEYIYP